MMRWIFTGIIVISVLVGFFGGRINDVSAAALSEAGNAVSLVISIMGNICLWSGIMAVAKVSGLTNIIARLLSPIVTRLFPDVPLDSPAMSYITMNMSANLLGLGNAATPLGLSAMHELNKLKPANGTATNAMVTFVVLNTASLTILPSTLAAMRLATGSSAPLDILPSMWVASFVSVVTGVTLAIILRKSASKR